MFPKALSTFPVITTQQLTLRRLRETDTEKIFLLRSDAEINKYLGRKRCETKEEALNFIKSIRENDALYWAITQKGNDTLIGTICLYDISDEKQSGEIGYELLTAYQGKGIMKEALQSVIDFAANIIGIKTIDGYMHKDNESSANLLLKFGFEKMDFNDESSPDLTLFRLTIKD